MDQPDLPLYRSWARKVIRSPDAPAAFLTLLLSNLWCGLSTTVELRWESSSSWDPVQKLGAKKVGRQQQSGAVSPSPTSKLWCSLSAKIEHRRQRSGNWATAERGRASMLADLQAGRLGGPWLLLLLPCISRSSKAPITPPAASSRRSTWQRIGHSAFWTSHASTHWAW